MASNLDPSTSTFTTANMLDKGNEDATEEFFNNALENTGFNYQGHDTKSWENYGRKVVNVVWIATGANSHTETITFSSDGNGQNTFGNTNYAIQLTIADPYNRSAANPITIDLLAYDFSSKTTTDFDITLEYTIGSGSGNGNFDVEFSWFVKGT